MKVICAGMNFALLLGKANTILGTEMHCFCTTGNVWAARSLTAEKIEVFKVNEVMDRPDTVGNVRWLLQMARSSYFTRDYPGYKVEAAEEFVGAQ